MRSAFSPAALLALGEVVGRVKARIEARQVQPAQASPAVDARATAARVALVELQLLHDRMKRAADGMNGQQAADLRRALVESRTRLEELVTLLGPASPVEAAAEAQAPKGAR